jgi:hypothetical protein
VVDRISSAEVAAPQLINVSVSRPDVYAPNFSVKLAGREPRNRKSDTSESSGPVILYRFGCAATPTVPYRGNDCRNKGRHLSPKAHRQRRRIERRMRCDGPDSLVNSHRKKCFEGAPERTVWFAHRRSGIAAEVCPITGMKSYCLIRTSIEHRYSWYILRLDHLSLRTIAAGWLAVQIEMIVGLSLSLFWTSPQGNVTFEVLIGQDLHWPLRQESGATASAMRPSDACLTLPRILIKM